MAVINKSCYWHTEHLHLHLHLHLQVDCLDNGDIRCCVNAANGTLVQECREEEGAAPHPSSLLLPPRGVGFFPLTPSVTCSAGEWKCAVAEQCIPRCDHLHLHLHLHLHMHQERAV